MVEILQKLRRTGRNVDKGLINPSYEKTVVNKISQK
jgi:hypothetical protein